MKYRSKKKWILAFELLLVVLFVVNSLPVSAYEKKMVDLAVGFRLCYDRAAWMCGRFCP